MQKKQSEWKWQWEKIYDNNKWLFTEWIYPTKLKDFKDKTVLDCGCGGGQHLNFIAPYCKKGVGIELNTYSVAKKNTRSKKNTIKKWFNPKEFKKIHISHYKGVSWRASGVKK